MIKLIVLDVDGCLTDGKIIYDNKGLESKQFNVKDGLGIVTWLKLGHEVAIITGRDSQIVANRAKELGIKHLYQGIKKKQETLQDLAASLLIGFDEIAAIGDDLNDYKMLRSVGHSFTPHNGVKEIQDIVTTRLSCNGGEGAVREMVDILIDRNKQTEQFMAVWL